jgi:hypothetical protein
MSIMPKLERGQLAEVTISGVRYLGLIKKTAMAPRRGMSPMVLIEWCGDPPRDYQEEYVEEHLLKLIEQ